MVTHGRRTGKMTVFDEESSKLSFDKRRHSDLKTVRRVHVPESSSYINVYAATLSNPNKS